MKTATRSRSKFRHRKFTLVEIMVAMIIVTVSMLGLYSTITSSRVNIYKDRLTEEANRVAIDRATLIKQIDYDTLAAYAELEQTGETDFDIPFKTGSSTGEAFYNGELGHLNGKITTTITEEEVDADPETSENEDGTQTISYYETRRCCIKVEVNWTVNNITKSTEVTIYKYQLVLPRQEIK